MKTSRLALVVACGAAMISLNSLIVLGRLLELSSFGNPPITSGTPVGQSFIKPSFTDNSRHSPASESPLNDKTLNWDPSVTRLWLQDHVQPKAPAVVTLTSLYWNHPNQTFGLTHFRTQLSREIMQAAVNHPWFHPTAWDDLVAGRWNNDSTRIYAFFDYETCSEKNYKEYGRGLGVNADRVGNRTNDWKRSHPQNPYRALVNMSVLFHYPQLKIIIIDCGGNGPKFYCLSRNHNPYDFVSLASISATSGDHFPQDQGFPPPLLKRVVLNQSVIDDISNCREGKRPYLITFSGNVRSPVRKQLRDFVHNGKDVLILYGTQMRDLGLEYEDMVLRSKFGAAPAGDNKFSYRFVEVMSGGAIPVLYADDLVLPFESIINWTEIAVRIPESESNRTREILESISDQQRCQMRQKMLQVFENYISTMDAVVKGIIEGLERKYKSGNWKYARHNGSFDQF